MNRNERKVDQVNIILDLSSKEVWLNGKRCIFHFIRDITDLVTSEFTRISN
jgi:hypothetical protein